MALFASRPELAILATRLLRGNVQIINGADVPTNAVTGAGSSKKGSLYLRTATGILYINVRTKASPRWVAMNK